MKTKVKKSAAGTTEKRLLKALDAVEKAAVPKEMRDADGGFATEGDGDELQVSASEDAEPKASKVKKSRKHRHEDEESSVVKAEESSVDDESSGEESSESSSESSSNDEESAPPMEMAYSKKKGKGGKAKKSIKKGKAEESSEESSVESSSELSGEESIGESPKPVKKAKHGKSVKKSHNGNIKKSLMEDPANAEVVNASEFIEQLLDSVSDSNASLTKSMHKQRAEQTEFNQRLAKGFTLLGDFVVAQGKELRKLRKALANVPMVQRGKTMLTKGDIAEREFEQTEGADQLDDETYRKSVDALMNLAVKGQVRPELVTQFEMAKSLDVLPANIREMIQGSLH